MPSSDLGPLCGGEGRKYTIPEVAKITSFSIEETLEKAHALEGSSHSWIVAVILIYSTPSAQSLTPFKIWHVALDRFPHT